MKHLDKVIIKIENYVCIITFVVMLVLAFVNVVSRFALHMSMSFTEEIVTSLFVLASLSGSSIAVRGKAHLGLDFFTGYLPANVQRILEVLAIILALVFCGIILYYGILMVGHEFLMGQKTATMQWPEWILGLTVPIGSGLLVIRYVLSLILDVNSLIGKEVV